jgi:hypothetical protein
MLRRLLLLTALLSSPAALAYPQYIARGHAQCASCHISPSGGGMASEFGYSANETIFTDLVPIEGLKKARAAASKENPDGEHFKVNGGADIRMLLLNAPADVGADPSLIPIPMLAEGQLLVGYKRWLLYATAAPKMRSTDTDNFTAISREHWVGVDLDDGTNTLRAGRLVAPFGLRMPDHTLHTREELMFDKYDQTYGVQWDRVSGDWATHAMAFAGDFLMEPARLREWGASGTVERVFLGEKLAVGASALFGTNAAYSRPAASLFVRARPLGTLYALGELAGQRLLFKSGGAQQSAAGLLRVGWLAAGVADLFAELSTRSIQGAPALGQQRLQLGLNIMPIPWMEVTPSLVLERTQGTGQLLSPQLQMHLFY